MLQSVKTIIDENGRVHLFKAVEPKNVRRALVTLLPDAAAQNKGGDFAADGDCILAGSIEILDEDFEGAIGEIAEMFQRSIERSGKELTGE